MPNPSLTIDLVPAILGFAVICSIILIVLAAYLRKASTHRQLWAAGILSFALGMLLLIARGQISDLLSIVLSNLLMIGGYAGFAAGTNRFVGRPLRVPFGIGAVAVLAFVVAHAMNASFEGRVTIFSLLSIAESVVIVLGFWKARRHWAALLGSVVFAINTAVALLRLLATLGLIAVPGGIGVLHAAVLNYGVAVTLGITLALIVLNVPMLRPKSKAATSEAMAETPSPEAWQLLQERSALLTPTGAEVRLTGSEYLLLRELGGQDEPVMRGTLNAAIGRDAENPKDRGIDILISRLKRKCVEAGIELPVTSVRGLGYVFHGRLRLN